HHWRTSETGVGRCGIGHVELERKQIPPPPEKCVHLGPCYGTVNTCCQKLFRSLSRAMLFFKKGFHFARRGAKITDRRMCNNIELRTSFKTTERKEHLYSVRAAAPGSHIPLGVGEQDPLSHQGGSQQGPAQGDRGHNKAPDPSGHGPLPEQMLYMFRADGVVGAHPRSWTGCQFPSVSGVGPHLRKPRKESTACPGMHVLSGRTGTKQTTQGEKATKPPPGPLTGNFPAVRSNDPSRPNCGW
ncbi:hypothetical protein AAFF_G00209240, partial [Aldrovandia affinis]